MQIKSGQRGIMHGDGDINIISSKGTTRAHMDGILQATTREEKRRGKKQV